MIFLGVKGNLRSRRSGRLGGRPSIPVWCNLPVRLTPGSGTNRLQPLAERQAPRALRKTAIIQSGPGCAPLTFETIYRFGTDGRAPETKSQEKQPRHDQRRYAHTPEEPGRCALDGSRRVKHRGELAGQAAVGELYPHLGASPEHSHLAVTQRDLGPHWAAVLSVCLHYRAGLVQVDADPGYGGRAVQLDRQVDRSSGTGKGPRGCNEQAPQCQNEQPGS
jgi:hypothetical protein